MQKLTRRQALPAIAGGLLGVGIAGGYFLRDLFSSPGMMGSTGGSPMMGGSMMGSASAADMSTYMELFDRHRELRRRVEVIPGGVRTITESDSPELAARLQSHVASMYQHLRDGAEVECMSDSLPTLFGNADSYRRTLRLTPHGVAVTERSNDPRLVPVIRAHAAEVSGFVRDGMPAMMRSMTG